MEDKAIVFQNPDGSCGVIHPSPDMFDPKSRTRENLAARGITFKTDKKVMEWIAAKDVPAGAPFLIVDKASLPDRSFRVAWTVDGKIVGVDMGKARAMHMARLRGQRNEKLAALDIEFQKSLETGDEAARASIVKQKQALRDMTITADLSVIQAADELKAFMPDVLKG